MSRAGRELKTWLAKPMRMGQACRPKLEVGPPWIQTRESLSRRAPARGHLRLTGNKASRYSPPSARARIPAPRGAALRLEIRAMRGRL
jgi:hypothetical protein